MPTTLASLFVGLSSVGLLFALLAFIQVGVSTIESGAARQRDGISPGKRAPRWSRTDTAERLHTVPDGSRWQALLFADHSLAAFPDLVTGLRDMAINEPAIELLAIARSQEGFADAALSVLGVECPVVSVDRAFYLRHNVHAMPFLTFVDPGGVVRANGLINDTADLRHVWRVAQTEAGTLGAAT